MLLVNISTILLNRTKKAQYKAKVDKNVLKLCLSIIVVHFTIHLFLQKGLEDDDYHYSIFPVVF